MILPDVTLSGVTADLARELGGHLGMPPDEAIRYCLPELLHKYRPKRKFAANLPARPLLSVPYVRFLQQCPRGVALFVENAAFYEAFNAYLRTIDRAQVSHKAFTMSMKRFGLDTDGRKDRPPRWLGIGLPVGEVLP